MASGHGHGALPFLIFVDHGQMQWPVAMANGYVQRPSHVLVVLGCSYWPRVGLNIVRSKRNVAAAAAQIMGYTYRQYVSDHDGANKEICHKGFSVLKEALTCPTARYMVRSRCPSICGMILDRAIEQKKIPSDTELLEQSLDMDEQSLDMDTSTALVASASDAALASGAPASDEQDIVAATPASGAPSSDEQAIVEATPASSAAASVGQELDEREWRRWYAPMTAQEYADEFVDDGIEIKPQEFFSTPPAQT